MKPTSDDTNAFAAWTKRLTPLLVALAILLAFVFLAARIYESARDSHIFWRQEQLKRERAVERIRTLQGEYQVTRATREP